MATENTTTSTPHVATDFQLTFSLDVDTSTVVHSFTGWFHTITVNSGANIDGVRHNTATMMTRVAGSDRIVMFHETHDIRFNITINPMVVKAFSLYKTTLHHRYVAFPLSKAIARSSRSTSLFT